MKILVFDNFQLPIDFFCGFLEFRDAVLDNERGFWQISVPIKPNYFGNVKSRLNFVYLQKEQGHYKDRNAQEFHYFDF